MRLLDLACGQGGAGKGYADAGWDVTGVDHAEQPRYLYEFHRADLLDVLDQLAATGEPWPGAGPVDAVHVSPPCQAFTVPSTWQGHPGRHRDLLRPVLDRLGRLGLPYVVENVPAAAGIMRPDFLLCGTQFGLAVTRHRIFQVNWQGFGLLPPHACYRNKALIPFIHKYEVAFKNAMGCGWMTNKGSREAIPPAYTEYLGRMMAESIQEGKTSAIVHNRV